MMSSSSDTIWFHFASHGDSILGKMNALREEHRFCDITLLLGGAPGIRPLHFHGHRVVLGASSDFLRDQFLLHGGQAELRVCIVSSVEVGKRLLLSCYTGLLEVPLRELVSYLTAASALQMSQVVEKCAQAISQYLSPMLPFVKMESGLKEEKTQQSDNHKNQEERNAAQPSNSKEEASTKEGRSQSESQTVKDISSDRGMKTELSNGAGCCLRSEEGGEIHQNKPSDLDHHITGTQRHKPCPNTAVRDHIPSPARGGSSQHKELVDSSQYRNKDAGLEEQREEAEAVQLQEELMDSTRNILCLPGAQLPKSSGDELAADSDTILVQRPYLCRRCDRVFQHLESYVGHLKEHRRYLCLVCGEGFSQKTNLTHHIRIHAGVKPLRCPLCHKTFSQRATLQDHFNLHTGDKSNYCAVHFAHKPGLRRHLREIHGKSSLQNMLEEDVE